MLNNKIVHRDINLQHILIKYENKEKTSFIFKLSGYRNSSQTSINNLCLIHAGIGTSMAPEILEGKNFNNKCDLWSIGVIIYQLLFNEFPYNGQTEYALLNNIKNLGLRNLKKSEDIHLNDLIFRLLIRDIKERISWEEYFSHPFFTKVWQNVIKAETPSNQIIIKLKVSQSDKIRYQKIYFLDNVFLMRDGEKIKNEEKFKELNNENCELYINNIKNDFQKYFEPNLEGGEEFTIKLIIKSKIKTCNSMFKNCFQITSIDLSSFNSSEVEDMSLMFYKCFNLQKLTLGNLDTKNVNNMARMFQKCKSLGKIYFPPSFDTNM